MKKCYFILFLSISWGAMAQVANPVLSSNEARQILQGQYNPATYSASAVIDNPDIIACNLMQEVQADSLQSHLQQLINFGTRHTWSDTVSSRQGIGAARRWAFAKMQQFGRRNDSRLQPAYLSFDIPNNSCGTLNGTKNVLGILPGVDTSDASVIVIEAHMDSRCAGRCDTACAAPGADDNGSGSALVLELARVMSKYTFERTIVFMLTTGEEQGLLGATAFADYAVQNNVDLHLILNNDIVGGIICGQTASPPGCNPPGSIDSTRLRLYANPLSRRFAHQSLGRTVKLLYDEKIAPNVAVPMKIELQNQSDRTGRGGDHLPFNTIAPAIRFTSAHEHGNGNPSGTPNYVDHQHTSSDEIGVDTDGDSRIDSFFVDFNYMARNAVVNGVSASYFAHGPASPEFKLNSTANGLEVQIEDAGGAQQFRVGTKGYGGAIFDSIYRFTDSAFVIPNQVQGQFYMVAVAGINAQGITGPFTEDAQGNAPASSSMAAPDNSLTMSCGSVGLMEQPLAVPFGKLVLSDPMPNPSAEQFGFKLRVKEGLHAHQGRFIVLDQLGRKITQMEVPVQQQLNEFQYRHQGGSGIYYYYVVVDGMRSRVGKLQVL